MHPSCAPWFVSLALLAGCASPPPALLAQAPVRATAPSVTLELEPTVSLVPEPPVPAQVLAMKADAVESEGTGEVHALSATVQSTWRDLLHAVKTGDRTLLPGVLPAYPTLAAEDVAAAAARGAGRTLDHACISSTPTGERFSEPVGMVVHGTPAAFRAALEGRKWVEANSRSPWNYVKMAGSVITRLWNEEASPVSAMYLDGKLELYALNKNSDYVLARDHLRVYAGAGGTLNVAATRDVAATVTFHHPQAGSTVWKPKLQAPSFGHRTDDDCDHERDLVLTDLLASGRVRDWAIVQGHLTSPANVKQLADGTWMVGHYHTDGLVYEVWLDTKP